MDRFWTKASLAPNGCLVWTAGRFKDGYGGFSLRGRTQRAHRVAWEISKSPVPDGFQVLHRCDNPLCVNPDHLFLGTVGDNMKDMVQKKRNVPGRAKLANADIESIRGSRMPAEDLAKKYDVTWRTIYHVRGGYTWKDD